MITCAANNCLEKCMVRYNPKATSRVTFHTFPTDVKLRQKWLNAIGRKYFVPTKRSYLCSKHFEPNCFLDKGLISGYCILKKDAVPTIFDFSRNTFQHRRKFAKENIETIVPVQIVTETSSEEEESEPDEDPLSLTLEKNEISILQNKTPTISTPMNVIACGCEHDALKQVNPTIHNCLVAGCNVNSIDNPKEIFSRLPFKHNLILCNCVDFIDRTDAGEFLSKDLKICEQHYNNNLILNILKSKHFEEELKQERKTDNQLFFITDVTNDLKIVDNSKDDNIIQEEVLEEKDVIKQEAVDVKLDDVIQEEIEIKQEILTKEEHPFLLEIKDQYDEF